MGDYGSHAAPCASRSNRAGPVFPEDVEALKRENAQLKKQLRDCGQENAQLKKQLRDRPNVPQLFQGEHNYRREDVVQLSQLISRYLEDKPTEIDSNKIFNCVRLMYMDLERNYADNPEITELT